MTYENPDRTQPQPENRKIWKTPHFAALGNVAADTQHNNTTATVNDGTGVDGWYS